jgi:hypothetical protein
MTDPDTVGDAPDGSLSFIGTATTLLRFGAFMVRTDPNFLVEVRDRRPAARVRLSCWGDVMPMRASVNAA